MTKKHADELCDCGEVKLRKGPRTFTECPPCRLKTIGRLMPDIVDIVAEELGPLDLTGTIYGHPQTEGAIRRTKTGRATVAAWCVMCRVRDVGHVSVAEYMEVDKGAVQGGVPRMEALARADQYVAEFLEKCVSRINEMHPLDT